MTYKKETGRNRNQNGDAAARRNRRPNQSDRMEQRRRREENGGSSGFAGRDGRRNGQPARERQQSRADRFERTDGVEIREDRQELASRVLEGRNPVLEAYRAGKTIDRLMVQSGVMDGPIQSILREAKKAGTVVDFLPRERLDQLSVTGMHQGVIAYAAFCDYVEVEDILAAAREKGEAPFLFLLDDIEDPHNLGAIIRTANLAGAHGVIIPKRRAVGVTATVARASAGAVNYTPIARVTNLANTIEALKKEGIWFACADMDGEVMYRTNLTGPLGLVIGNEGSGVSRLVKEKCDYVVRIPMHGSIDSLNASVAAGVLAFEIVRQREFV